MMLCSLWDCFTRAIPRHAGQPRGALLHHRPPRAVGGGLCVGRRRRGLRRGAAAKRRRASAALSASGIRPVDGSLSALVLAAYRLWGEEYPSRLGGPVVSAVIDQDAGRLILSRDRMGELPVFYAYRGGSMAFADHPAKLLESPVATRIVDREGVVRAFWRRPRAHPGTHAAAGCVRAAAGLRADRERPRSQGAALFCAGTRPHEDSEAVTVETVRFLCEQAVEDALPLSPAAMLSGGLDSTALTALLARRATRTGGQLFGGLRGQRGILRPRRLSAGARRALRPGGRGPHRHPPSERGPPAAFARGNAGGSPGAPGAARHGGHRFRADALCPPHRAGSPGSDLRRVR